MIKHLLRSIFLNLKKSGWVTLFNILGLTVSMAAFIMLSIFIVNELTYDQNNANYKNIYRLGVKGTYNGAPYTTSSLPNPLADLLNDNIPELENLCSFASRNYTYSKSEDTDKNYSINTMGVDSTFTDIFTIHIKSGNQNPLRGENKIILSESAAAKMFGAENPVGKTIIANFNTPYYIDAVYFDLPTNSTLKKYDAFCSYPTDDWVNDWSEWSFNHFFIVTEHTSFTDLNQKINENSTVKETFGIGEEESEKVEFEFLPLKDLHFNDENGAGNKTFVKTLILISFLILIMAFVNYLNFAFTNAPKLIKSVNIRSVVGESRRRLLLNSLLEYVVLITVSFLLALLLCNIVTLMVPDIIGFRVVFTNYLWLLLAIFMLLVAIGLVVSYFPAKITTMVKPALALKGLVPLSARKGGVGKVLTVVQYTFSIVLIIGILLIEKQIDYIKNYDLGFDKENILVVNTSPEIRKQEKAFVNELLKNPKITNYAFSQFIPSGVGMGWGREVDGKTVNFKCWPVDERYLDFMGFEIVEGRKFSNNIKADENKFIFNETAIKTFKWEENALGKMVPGFGFEGELVGIVKDMKYASLYQEVQPMAFWLTKERHNRLSLKIAGTDVAATIKHIENTYKRFEKKYTFSYHFLDEKLNAQYKNTEKQAQLILIFCLISLFVSIIGALGMVLFLCEYRVKEIGVRKVNGAKTFEIMKVLNQSFLIQVFVAFVIASPLAYFAMQKWLENFAYKTILSWWIFALAGAVAFGIALLSVSWHTYRAARRNPVKALQYE